MLTLFWPSIQQFMDNNPTHKHANQWSTCFNQGLNQYLNLALVYSIIGTEILDQLFFFHDSPAIHPYNELVWDHKINYWLKQPAVFSHNTGTFTVTPTQANKDACDDSSHETIHNTVHTDIHDINFGIFHIKDLYPTKKACYSEEHYSSCTMA
jgi:hypothetical protein